AAGGGVQGPAGAGVGAARDFRGAGPDDGGRGPGARAMKVLVTGADGFAGRWLVRRLLADGREVYGATRPSQDAPRGAGSGDLSVEEREAVHWVPLEPTDQESVRACVDVRHDPIGHPGALSCVR